MTNEQYREACMEKFDAMSHELSERARVNIEKYRKGDHTLRILDENGAPVVGARVKVTQKDHDFKHGANIFMLDEYEDNEINERYRDQFAKHFNLATVPFYWNATEPEEGKPRYDANSPKLYRRPPTDLCVNYCEEKGILPKIHCLCYDKMIPDWLPKNDSAAMWRLYEKRFAEIAERYEGRMYEVEVTNELISAHKWGDLCSVVANERDVGIKMWQMARKYFPNDKLLSNDAYPKDVGLRMHNDQYYLMLKRWLSQGAPIDKIGVQNHIFCGMKGKDRIDYDILKRLDHFDPTIMLRGLDILSEFGKPLEITEVTIPTLGEGEEAEQLQADILYLAGIQGLSDSDLFYRQDFFGIYEGIVSEDFGTADPQILESEILGGDNLRGNRMSVKDGCLNIAFYHEDNSEQNAFYRNVKALMLQDFTLPPDP